MSFLTYGLLLRCTFSSSSSSLASSASLYKHSIQGSNRIGSQASDRIALPRVSHSFAFCLCYSYGRLVNGGASTGLCCLFYATTTAADYDDDAPRYEQVNGKFPLRIPLCRSYALFPYLLLRRYALLIEHTSAADTLYHSFIHSFPFCPPTRKQRSLLTPCNILFNSPADQLRCPRRIQTCR